jgi:hypothetical protein
MKICIFCDNLLTKSTKPEHILLNALGGRRKSSELICSMHNERFGSTIDNVLSEQVTVVRNILNLHSGDGKPPPTLRKVPAGSEILNIRGDGKLQIAGTPFTITECADGSIQLYIQARSPEHLEELIPHIAAKLKYSEQQLRQKLQEGQAAFTSRRPGAIHFSLSFGGPDAIRCATKSCLELWATVVGNAEVRSEPYAEARRFILDGSASFCHKRTFIDNRPLPITEYLETHFGEFFNFIYVKSNDNGRVIGHFTLYNMIAWKVILAEHGVSSNVNVGLVSNPLKPSAWCDSIAEHVNIEFTWLDAPVLDDDFERTKRRLGSMMEVNHSRSRNRELEKIITEEFSRAGLESITDDTDDEVRRRVLSYIARRAAEYFLSLPSYRHFTAGLAEFLGRDKPSA